MSSGNLKLVIINNAVKLQIVLHSGACITYNGGGGCFENCDVMYFIHRDREHEKQLQHVVSKKKKKK
jgi:hypothetical protein